MVFYEMNMPYKPSFEHKIISREDCVINTEKSLWKRPLVFTNGVFDILHRGHVSYLDEAASLGATLVVALNTDNSVKQLNKGSDRPINTLEDRAALMAALDCVSFVTSFHETTPVEIIKQIRPDIIVKGGDYIMAKLPETKLVESWGGKAVAIPVLHNKSTSKLIAKVRSNIS